MRFKLNGTIKIILAITILLCLPLSGSAQYLSFQYPQLFGINGPLAAGSSFSTYFPTYGGSPFQSPYLIYGGGLSYGGYTPYYSYYSYGIPYAQTYNPPDEPKTVDVSQIPSEYVKQIELVGDYCYLLLSSREAISTKEAIILRIVDISNPDNPAIVKDIGWDTFHNSIRIFPQDTYLFWIGLSPEGRRKEDNYLSKDIVGVFDITNPADPQEIDRIEIELDPEYEDTGDTFGFVGEDRAYIYYRKIKDGISGLVVIDISNPENLDMISFNGIVWPDEVPRIVHIIAKDNALILLDEKLYIMDVSDPEHPSILSTLDQNGGNGDHIPALFGSYLCIPGGRWLALVDINDITHPRKAAFMELPDQIERIIIQSNLLYMADLHRGLIVVDLSHPEAPEMLPGYRFPREYRNTHNLIRDLAVRGNLVYTGNFYDFLQIWDVSDPNDVIKRGEIGTSHSSIYPYQEREKIPGRLAVTLSIEANEIVSPGTSGDIATFGIPSLDQFNHKYGVFWIIPPRNSDPFLDDIYDRTYRRYILLFPETVDLYEIQEDYEDDPHCVIAEFEYGGWSYTSTSTSNEYSPSGYGYFGYRYYNSYNPVYAAFQGPFSSLEKGRNLWQYPSGNTWTINPPYGSSYGFVSWSPSVFQAQINPGGNNPLLFSLNNDPLSPFMSQIGLNIPNFGQFNPGLGGIMNPLIFGGRIEFPSYFPLLY